MEKNCNFSFLAKAFPMVFLYLGIVKKKNEKGDFYSRSFEGFEFF